MLGMREVMPADRTKDKAWSLQAGEKGTECFPDQDKAWKEFSPQDGEAGSREAASPPHLSTSTRSDDPESQLKKA